MRLLLSGYYGFGNLGDEAILEGLTGALKTRGFELTILSNAPQETRADYEVGASSRFLGTVPALLACDAFLSGGGGLLQDKTSRRSLQYYLTLIRLAKRLGKRVVVYAQSVGPLSETGRRSVAAALKGVPAAVRDEASQHLLAELGLPSALTADAALLLEPLPDVAKTDATLLIPRAGYPEITAGLERVAKGLVEAGRQVAVTSVQASEDRLEVERLRAAVPQLEPWPAENVSKLLEHTARASYVISGRLHGLILAAVAGTDFAGLVYDPKVRAFLQEAGARAFELPLDQGALLNCAFERPEVSRERVEALKERACRGIGWLEQQLRG